MTVQRPDRPVTRAEEIALAEAHDLPARLDGADRREPLAKVLEAERELDPRSSR